MTKKRIRVILGILILIFTFYLGSLTKNMSVKNSKPKNRTIAMYLENENGGYDLSSQNKFPTDGYVLNTEKSKCKNGGILSQDPTTKKLSLSVSNSDQCNVYFDKLTKSRETLIYLNQKSNGIKENFEDPAITDEGIFEMEDDYGTSYYYRGAVENNYVKYGVNAIGQEMWWRIIRINGDGTVRMIYDGTQGITGGTENTERYIKIDQPFNELYDDAKYVGWMYGPANAVDGTTTPSTSKEEAQSNIADSAAKKIVDAWYKNNIEDTGYGINVSDEIFCNDRSIPGKNVSNWNNDTGLGYSKNQTAYGLVVRALWGKQVTTPTFICPQQSDSFTVKDKIKGNGNLTYPVGLITGDEILAAGSGKHGTYNSKYYLYNEALYKNASYLWSMSPSAFFDNSQDLYAVMFTISANGEFFGTGTDGQKGFISPVINISQEYAKTLIGTGTVTDPYRHG